MYITRLASNEIFSLSNKIHREVGGVKDLSAPRYSSPDISGQITNEIGGACSTFGGEEKCLPGFLAGHPDGKRQLGKPRHGWWDSRKLILKNSCW
jgi:hypothetical protein